MARGVLAAARIREGTCRDRCALGAVLDGAAWPAVVPGQAKWCGRRVADDTGSQKKANRTRKRTASKLHFATNLKSPRKRTRIVPTRSSGVAGEVETAPAGNSCR